MLQPPDPAPQEFAKPALMNRHARALRPARVCAPSGSRRHRSGGCRRRSDGRRMRARLWALRGRAMAGARAVRRPRVFVQEFYAELVGVAGAFRVFETHTAGAQRPARTGLALRRRASFRPTRRVRHTILKTNSEGDQDVGYRDHRSDFRQRGRRQDDHFCQPRVRPRTARQACRRHRLRHRPAQSRPHHAGASGGVVYDFVNVIQGDCTLKQALIKDKRSRDPVRPRCVPDA